MQHEINLIKQQKRHDRLMCLYVLSEAYYKYQMLYLSQCAVRHGVSYSTAESTSQMINTIFNGNTSASDFVTSEDDMANHVIDYYNEYKAFVNSNVTVPIEVLNAFTRQAEHGNKTLLKFNHNGFQRQITALIMYNCGEITKAQLKDHLKDFCIFSKTPKKMNTVLFKRTIYTVESLYQEILSIKTARTLKKLKSCN